MKDVEVRLQMQLNAAAGADLSMLEARKGKRVIIVASVSSYPLECTLSGYGHQFLELADCEMYGYGIDELIDYKMSERTDPSIIKKKKVPDRMLARVHVEEIYLAEDIIGEPQNGR